MKTAPKIITGIGIALILFTIVINIQFTEKINNKLDDRILVAYSKGLGIGGIVSIAILDNGTIVNYDVHLDKKINQIDSDELTQIKNAINNNQFKISKISLLDKWRRNNPGCFDCDMSTSILINKNGETITIEPNGIIWNIISKIRLY
jgi:ribosomal protein S13